MIRIAMDFHIWCVLHLLSIWFRQNYGSTCDILRCFHDDVQRKTSFVLITRIRCLEDHMCVEKPYGDLCGSMEVVNVIVRKFYGIRPRKIWYPIVRVQMDSSLTLRENFYLLVNRTRYSKRSFQRSCRVQNPC